MFGSQIGFSGSADAVTLFSVRSNSGYEIGKRDFPEGRGAYLRYEEAGNKTAVLK